MIRAARPTRFTDRDRIAVAGAVCCAVIGALIWILWVLPITASVDAASAQPIGSSPAAVQLDAGARVGIWGRGISPTLGTMSCAVTAPSGDAVGQHGGPSLTWSDTLWWMTPKWGFEQVSRFTAPTAGEYLVVCTDSLQTYDGEFLVAGDAFGAGDIGLGRTGGADFAIGSVLAFGAIVCPLVAVLLGIILGIRALRLVAARRRASRRAFGGEFAADSAQAPGSGAGSS
ncbi:hypothetical protein [Microbacterium oxydans]|uniref:Uncharacterized protein n=1 Tax=Microbacterium oxydans TaxID=82380 RepID=A0A0F0LA65_9MICO|nr:hypothetical protein [Microbacterium oxydans]KJL28461.1 hypothetical protein RS83_03534 [Microbacterium oxydans]